MSTLNMTAHKAMTKMVIENMDDGENGHCSNRQDEKRVLSPE